MRILKKFIVPMVTVGLLGSGVVNFSGCSKHISPIGPDESLQKEQIKFLPLGKFLNSLAKTIKKATWIKKEKGGEIKLEHEFDNDEDGEVKVKINFKVEKNTLSHDAYIGLSIDEQMFIGNLDVEFTPHGIVFSNPAKLNIEIEMKDVDLSGMNLDKLDIYYDNKDSGEWEKMKSEKIEIKYDDNKLKIKVKNALIPHFSRYAVGSE
jgi:hypothetical protein